MTTLEPNGCGWLSQSIRQGAHRVQHFLSADLAGLHRRKLRAHKAMGLVEPDGTLYAEEGI